MLVDTCITWCSTWLVYNFEMKFEMHRVFNHITEKHKKGRKKHLNEWMGIVEISQTVGLILG